MIQNSALTSILIFSFLLCAQQVRTFPTRLQSLKEVEAENGDAPLNDFEQQKILAEELSKLIVAAAAAVKNSESTPVGGRQDEVDEEEIVLPSDIALPQVTQLVGAVLKGQLNITSALFHKNKIKIPASIRNPVKSIVKLLNSITQTSTLPPTTESETEEVVTSKRSRVTAPPTTTQAALKDVDWVIVPTYNVMGYGSTVAPSKLNRIKNSYRVRTKNKITSTTSTTSKPASSHVVYNFEDYAKDVQQWGASFGQHGGGTFF